SVKKKDFNLCIFIVFLGLEGNALANETLKGKVNNSNASISQAVINGEVTGSLRTFYYTTHHAYFSQNLNQDTISYGGFVKYETAPVYGFNMGLGGIFLRGINHPPESREIADIGKNQMNIGEAYLSWHNDKLRITGGNQRLHLPFAGDYDWRITPILYQAIDINYGEDSSFLHATKIWRYKNWARDTMQKTTSYNEIKTKNNGMWAIGAGHQLILGENKIRGVTWYENYNDITRIFYAEGHIQWQHHTMTPDLGLQFIRGTGQGKKLLGNINNRSVGAQISLKPLSNLSWKLGVDFIAHNKDSYGYGSLVTPYAHNTTSGPYFAQPYFTSTQDLGSGNAWATNINWDINKNLTTGARYSWMNLTSSSTLSSRRQSEYLIYFNWHFQGYLSGLTLSNYTGVQTSPLYAHRFWQSRMELKYNF
ncbi:TPA: TonB-dependent receptor, partial [Salmonella enterica]